MDGEIFTWGNRRTQNRRRRRLLVTTATLCRKLKGANLFPRFGSIILHSQMNYCGFVEKLDFQEELVWWAVSASSTLASKSSLIFAIILESFPFASLRILLKFFNHPTLSFSPISISCWGNWCSHTHRMLRFNSLNSLQDSHQSGNRRLRKQQFFLPFDRLDWSYSILKLYWVNWANL